MPHCVTLGQVAERANSLERLEALLPARTDNLSFLAHPHAVRTRLLKLAHQYPLRRPPASPPHGRS